jgi:phospholipid/cholesterol/gamma-HCH transport system substrate-binding protein
MSRTLRLGIFVVFTLCVLCAGIFLIGDQRMLFHRTYRLYAQFPTVNGLGNGAEVRVGGIHEGTVKDIALPNSPNGQVTIKMDVGASTHNVIKADSVASIAAEGLVGDKFVTITFGSSDAPEVKNGDTIKSEPPVETAAMVKKADKILDDLQNAVGNLSSIGGKINQGAGTVGALVNDKSLYNKFNNAAGSLQDDAEALKHNFLLRGFFNKRGYEDQAELTRNAISQLPERPVLQKFDLDAKQLFDKPDNTKLKNEKPLNQPGKFLESTQFSLAVVKAETAMTGDSAKDREITEARAAVIRDYLVNNFKLADTRIKTLGAGKSKDPTATSAVQILVYR